MVGLGLVRAGPSLFCFHLVMGWAINEKKAAKKVRGLFCDRFYLLELDVTKGDDNMPI